MSETEFVERAGRSVRLSKRGRITRLALLDSTLRLVAERGYADTTIQAVLDHSGVSRGSLLHQFTTRHELMVAAADLAMRRMLCSMDERVSAFDDPIEALYQYPDIMWDTFNDIPARVSIEMQLASRWDKELFKGLKKVIAEIEGRIVTDSRDFAEKIGLKDPDGLLLTNSILFDAMQGLAIRKSLTSNPPGIEAALNALKQTYLAALEQRLPRRRTGPRRSKNL